MNSNQLIVLVNSRVNAIYNEVDYLEVDYLKVGYLETDNALIILEGHKAGQRARSTSLYRSPSCLKPTSLAEGVSSGGKHPNKFSIIGFGS